LGAILIGVAAIKRLRQIASFTRDWHHVLRIITTDPGRDNIIVTILLG